MKRFTMRKDSRSDSALLTATREGDPEAFGVFFRRRYPVVLAYFGRRVGPDAAADLTAETFAAVLESMTESGGAPVEHVTSWLLTVARNKLVDSVRHGRVEDASRLRLGMEPVVLDDGDLTQVTDVAGDVAIHELIERQLSPDESRAVRARILDERDYRDIARELQCSEAVVRQRVSRGLRRLRSSLPREL